MRINYGATDRKRMVKAIGDALDEKPIYQGVPSCAYQIAEFGDQGRGSGIPR